MFGTFVVCFCLANSRVPEFPFWQGVMEHVHFFVNDLPFIGMLLLVLLMLLELMRIRKQPPE